MSDCRRMDRSSVCTGLAKPECWLNRFATGKSEAAWKAKTTSSAHGLHGCTGQVKGSTAAMCRLRQLMTFRQPVSLTS